jgi:hypothetical protein
MGCATPIAGQRKYMVKMDLRELLSRKASAAYTGNKDKGMIVIIKPSKKSNYKK